MLKPTYPERLSIAHLPTPLEKMSRLSRALGGPEIYVKRDDLTGLATGGNKTRKLEFLLADALAQGCDHLITIGAPQSNHCRQTAAAAACHGLAAARPARRRWRARDGNILLTCWRPHLLTEGQPGNEIIRIAAEQRKLGRMPARSLWLQRHGATTRAVMKELMEQLAAENLNIDFIVFASSSGGTWSVS